MNSKAKPQTGSIILRWSVIGAVALVALLGSYGFAMARNGVARAASSVSAVPAQAPVAAASTGSGGAGCACCGTGAAKSGPAVTRQAEVAGGVQRIAVYVSKGYYDPDTIELVAGVPAEITFSESSGCTYQVQSADLGFSEDLSQGPVTVKLPALAAGSYGFNCGMQMVFGSIVVK